MTELTASELYRQEMEKRHLQLPHRQDGKHHAPGPDRLPLCVKCKSVHVGLVTSMKKLRLVTANGVLMRCSECDFVFRSNSRVAKKIALDHLLPRGDSRYRVGVIRA